MLYWPPFHLLSYATDYGVESSLTNVNRSDVQDLTRVLVVAAQIACDFNKNVFLHRCPPKRKPLFLHMQHILTCGIWGLVQMVALR